MSQNIRVMMLGAVTLVAGAIMGFVPRVPQSLDYHRFADQRNFLGIPIFLNVISNIPFLIVGVRALIVVLGQRARLLDAKLGPSLIQFPYFQQERVRSSGGLSREAHAVPNETPKGAGLRAGNPKQESARREVRRPRPGDRTVFPRPVSGSRAPGIQARGLVHGPRRAAAAGGRYSRFAGAVIRSVTVRQDRVLRVGQGLLAIGRRSWRDFTIQSRSFWSRVNRVTVMGRVNSRIGSLALACAFVVAGGTQIMNAIDRFSDTPAPSSTSRASSSKKQHEATRRAPRINRRAILRAAHVSTPPASPPAARTATSPDALSLFATIPASAPAADPKAGWMASVPIPATVVILAPDSATPPDNRPANSAAPAGAPAPETEKGWTPAAYFNSRLPQWLRLSGQFRNRDEAPTAYGFKSSDNDAYALTRTVLQLDAAPASWFHAFVQARDAEVMGANPKNVTSSMKDAFDLEQAYIELRDKEHGSVSLQAGRQQMSYGDERLIGRSDWSNASRSFDAVRLRLESQTYGVRADVFASSVVKNYPTSLDKVLAGQNFYGTDVALTKLVPKVTIEPYLYVKTLPSVKGVDKLPGNERLYASGLRLRGGFGGSFDYRVRYTVESGHLADDPIHAWGGYGVLGYTIPHSRLNPRFSIEYAYSSGDKTVGDRVIGTFDQLYPTTHGQRGIADLFAEDNIKDLKPAFDFNPMKKMKISFMVNHLGLASRYDSLYDPHSEAVIVKVPKRGALSTDVGTEGDIYGSYDINPRLQLGAGVGHLYDGPFLKENSAGGSVTYPYVMLDYHF
jgi:hypothetical protein